MSTTVSAKYRHRRGTELSTPTLYDGEMYVCTDNDKIIKGTSTGNKVVSDIKNTVLSTSIDLNLYVAPTGNDVTGDGTSAKPYLTIGKAIGILTKHNANIININVADGAYNEDIVLKIGGTGTINITGNVTTPTNVNVNSFSVSDGCVVNIKGFNATTTTKHSFIFQRCNGSITNCTATTDGKTNSVSGLYCTSAKVASATCTFSNKNAGIYCGVNADVSSISSNGVNNNYGVYSESNGSVSILGTFPLGANPNVTYAGGVINFASGTQTVDTTRDTSIAGIQTITGLLGVPRRIEIKAFQNDGLNIRFSNGSWESMGNAQGCVCIYKNSSNNIVTGGLTNSAVVLQTNESAYCTATVQNITSSQFELNWSKIGVPTGNVTLIIVITY